VKTMGGMLHTIHIGLNKELRRGRVPHDVYLAVRRGISEIEDALGLSAAEIAGRRYERNRNLKRRGVRR
jgi:hypothetical protein